MNEWKEQLLRLLEQYEGDTKELLRCHPELEYLYALSDMRESLLEWYPFEPGASLLQIGSDSGAMTGLYARRVAQVTVLDGGPEDFEVSAYRHREIGNIRYVEGSLKGYADTLGQDERYDYVVMVGSLHAPYEESLAAAKRLLKPQGKLITAVCNANGVKYLAGARRDRDSFSRKRLTELLCPDGREGRLRWYYPIPDYKLAYTIYSDQYLPGKGDLTHTIVAYDYPEYLAMDVGAKFDEVCEDGQFEEYANSFLVIWSADERD